MTTPADTSAFLTEALANGLVKRSRGPHINSGKECTVYSRSEPVRVLWMPDDEAQEVVLQDGLEGEGQWFVAEQTDTMWLVTHDFWDERLDESAQERVLSGSRSEAVDYLLQQLLETSAGAV